MKRIEEAFSIQMVIKSLHEVREVPEVRPVGITDPVGLSDQKRHPGHQDAAAAAMEGAMAAVSSLNWLLRSSKGNDLGGMVLVLCYICDKQM